MLNSIENRAATQYYTGMARVKKFELENPVTIPDDEDRETLAAIDEGLRDAEAGRTVPAEKVRKLLPQWITASSTRKGR
jgi:predicted transcriptional regulator